MFSKITVVAALVCGLAPALPAHAAAEAACFGRAATITGTPRDDRLRGTSGADVIVAGGGSDRIAGLGGNDRICGGTGDDVIDAGPGRDRVLGGLSEDLIRGDAGPDFVDGGDQDDELHGNGGNDRLILGGIGREVEYAYGGLGRDSIVSESAAVTRAYGNKGSDRLVGRGRGDFLDGGPGDDRIEGGIATFESSTEGVGVNVEAGTAEGAGDDVLVDVLGVQGSPHDDRITGGRRAEWIQGMDGDDTLYGAMGDDNVAGGKGSDVVWGNRGADVLWDAESECHFGCDADDATDEFDGGPGEDIVTYEGHRSGVTADIEAGTGDDSDSIAEVENLMGSWFDDQLFGSMGGNDMFGLDGSDRIEARGSDDFLDGGDGSDTLDGGLHTDTCDNGEVLISCEE